MVFSSITFLFYFLPVTAGLYFLSPRKIKNPVILAASLIFYAWGEPVYVFLMVFSILMNYVSGILLSKKKTPGILAIGIGLNILLLGFFKYADFLINTLNGMFSLNISSLNLPLPIGISFYTFQAMSYLIDYYRGQVKLQKNIIDFAVYIALFPQLIAGPIVRIKTIEHQLHYREHTWEKFAAGTRRFVIGLSKKVLIANSLGIIWDQISGGNIESLPVLSAWIGAAAFTLQIYFDFSGYSDMAIGLGKIFGFDFPENFRYPYMSKSITEFWRRWHITLGTWFREYVYIPLGGNKRGLPRQLLNILIVWMLTGLWHGAAWNFVIWGLYFAIILLFEKVFLLKLLERLPGIITTIYTLFLVMISWVIFALDSIKDICSYICAMFGLSGVGLADSQSLYILSGNLIIFAVAIIGATGLPAITGNRILTRIGHEKTAAGITEGIWLAALLVLSTAFITASTYNPFLYFRF